MKLSYFIIFIPNPYNIPECVGDCRDMLTKKLKSYILLSASGFKEIYSLEKEGFAQNKLLHVRDCPFDLKCLLLLTTEEG